MTNYSSQRAITLYFSSNTFDSRQISERYVNAIGLLTNEKCYTDLYGFIDSKKIQISTQQLLLVAKTSMDAYNHDQGWVQLQKNQINYNYLTFF